jgi:uncharacterized protein
MRTYSFFTIVLLCITLILVDVLAFNGLQSIIHFTSFSYLKGIINFLFWFFTFGLITAIIIFKIRLDRIPLQRRNLLLTSLYGLTISSFFPKLIFVVVVTILNYFKFFISGEQSLILPIIGLVAGFFPFFIIIYGIFRTLYRFKTYYVKVEFETLPKAFNNLRIVHISDLHLGSFNYRYHILERAIKSINELEPDLIFFTGDLVNNYAWELKGWDKVLKQLNSKIGKFSVLGNHDYGDYSRWRSESDKHKNFEHIKEFHNKIGFTLLLNDAKIIELENEQIAVVGVENWGKPPFKKYGKLKKSLQDADDVTFKMLLSHDPSHWTEEVLGKTDIAITFSGHTHGMQMGFHLKNRKWSPIKYKYKQWGGLYKEGNQYLYVNRGLGWLGFPGRIGMRPEITFLEFISKK